MSRSSKRRAKARQNLAMGADQSKITSDNIQDFMGKVTFQFYDENKNMIDLSKLEVQAKGPHKGKITKTELIKAMK